MKKKNTQDVARELYITAGLCVTTIARILKITDATVNDWATTGDWATQKKDPLPTPYRLIGMMEAEIREISERASHRTETSGLPTSTESRTRDVIVQSIAMYRTRIGLSPAMDVMNSLLEFARATVPDLLDALTVIANQYIGVLTQTETHARSKLVTVVPGEPDVL